jgi:hypothetical protein
VQNPYGKLKTFTVSRKMYDYRVFFIELVNFGASDFVSLLLQVYCNVIDRKVSVSTSRDLVPFKFNPQSFQPSHFNPVNSTHNQFNPSEFNPVISTQSFQPSHFNPRSFQPTVISTHSHFNPWSFQPSHFNPVISTQSFQPTVISTHSHFNPQSTYSN